MILKCKVLEVQDGKEVVVSLLGTLQPEDRHDVDNMPKLCAGDEIEIPNVCLMLHPEAPGQLSLPMANA